MSNTVTRTTIHPKYLHLYPEEAKGEEIAFLTKLNYGGDTHFPIIIPPTAQVTMGGYPTSITGPTYIQVLFKHTVHYVTNNSPLGKVLNG